MEADSRPLSASVSVEQKIKLAKFEMAGVFLSISGVSAETTSEEMDELLAQSTLAFGKLVKQIKVKAQTLRDKLDY